MAPPRPYTPFDSERLCFRAVRTTEDLPLFIEIAHDQAGYANSSRSNISLPTSTEVEKFAKSLGEECLLGAVIWLKPKHDTEQGSAQQDVEGGEAPSSTEQDNTITPAALKSRWGTAIGEIHLSRSSPETAHHRATELGIDILPAYQGRGYGAETINWALDYAFRRAGLHRVRIRAMEWNEGALRLYERLGFTCEGRERESLWHEGRWWDCVEYGMLEDEWWPLQWAKEVKEKEEKEKEVTDNVI
jgi:RimJ/RimL family protein N-acetyltransferase